MVISLYVDGGVLGKNPSVEGVYWSVARDCPDGSHKRLVERAQNKTYFTNNDAEYLAVLEALSQVGAIGVKNGDKVVIHSDSQLIVNQVNGKWSVYEERLANLKRLVSQGIEFYTRSGVEVEVTWVRRQENVKRLGH